MPPIAQYRHPSVHYCGDRGSITGGYVYRGEDIPALHGRYVFADYCTGEVWSAPVEGHKLGAVRTEVARSKDARPLTSFGRDGSGELYLVSATGVVYKLVAAGDE